jgi:hypothetical protein
MEIKVMLDRLKEKGFTAKAIEAELEFSNGSLGKVLSSARMAKFKSFYDLHCGSGKSGVEYLQLYGGIKVSPTEDALRLYFPDLFKKTLPSANEIEVPLVVPTRTAFTSAADLRHLLDERYNGMFDTNDSKEVIDVVDYKKLFDGCEFPDEYKALWEKIKVDPTMSDKEKNVWKLTLNAK